MNSRIPRFLNRIIYFIVSISLFLIASGVTIRIYRRIPMNQYFTSGQAETQQTVGSRPIDTVRMNLRRGNNASRDNNLSARATAQLRERRSQLQDSAANLAGLNPNYLEEEVVANTEIPEIDLTKQLMYPPIQTFEKPSPTQILYEAPLDNNYTILPFGAIFSMITGAIPRLGNAIQNINDNRQQRTFEEIIRNPRLNDFNAQNNNIDNSNNMQNVLFDKTRSALSIITYVFILLISLTGISWLAGLGITLGGYALRSVYQTGRVLTREIRITRALPATNNSRTDQPRQIQEEENNNWIE